MFKFLKSKLFKICCPHDNKIITDFYIENDGDWLDCGEDSNYETCRATAKFICKDCRAGWLKFSPCVMREKGDSGSLIFN